MLGELSHENIMVFFDKWKDHHCYVIADNLLRFVGIPFVDFNTKTWKSLSWNNWKNDMSLFPATNQERPSEQLLQYSFSLENKHALFRIKILRR